MRNACIDELLAAAAADSRICLIVGDLGFSVVEPFAARFPGRFLNSGVNEQAMTGIAAGMALAGLKPFTYSIANFPTLRCLEQIRNDVCHHAADVVVVAVGAGFAYGPLGHSHHAVQDLACLRSLPGMLLATPADPLETRAAVRALVRLGKGGDPVLHAAAPDLAVGQPVALAAGGPDAVLACGGIASEAVAAANEHGAAAYSLPLWRDDAPTRDALIGLVAAHRRLVVVEEHVRAGGVGSFVREALAERGELHGRLRCLAIDPQALAQVGSVAALRRLAGIDRQAISAALTGP